MRHQKKIMHLGREHGHRRLLMKNLATSFLLYEKIETTVAKAKLLRPYAERLITASKVDTLAARRQALSKLTHKNATKKLFEVLGPRYKDRKGGYTRIRRTARRVGDRAEMAILSLVE
jgi:large subunit ribosomal protein L17